MRSLFYLPLLLLNGSLFSDHQIFIDPTGTYLLKGEVKKNKIVGHSGEFRVRLLNANTVAMCLYLNKGEPGYESGFFTRDTLCIMEINSMRLYLRLTIRPALSILYSQ